MEKRCAKLHKSVPQEAKGYHPPKRPDYGKKGRKFLAVTNFCELHVRPELRVFQYDVKFVPSVDDPDRRRRLLMETCRPSLLLGGGCGWCYDGTSILFTAQRELALTPEALAEGWSAEVEGKRFVKPLPQAPRRDGNVRQTVPTVSITRCESEPVEFDGLASGRLQDSVPNIRLQFMALDVMLKQDSSARFKVIGDAFYDERREAAWSKIKTLGRHDSGVELWLGYRQSLVMTEKGPMLQIDKAATTMLAPLLLLEFLAKKLRCRPEQLDTRKLVSCRVSAEMTRGHQKWKVSALHASRIYKVRGLTEVGADQCFFDGGEEFGRISVAEWFKRVHKDFPLGRPDLPCIQAGPEKDPNKILIPLELCKLVAGQPQREIISEIQQVMLLQHHDASVPV